MSYGLIYTVPFANMDNIPCVVEIEKEDYTGISTELIAGETPFVIDIDNEEFLYTPTRFSTAKLTIVGNDYLRSLFSTAYRQYRVTLKVGDIVTWCGFIKPELYTQDYSSETFILEIECISAMSVLEFIDYTTEEKDKNFVYIWSILKRCITMSNGKYEAVFLPYVYAKTKKEYIEGTNILESMVVSEQNFFDEEEKPMKLNEVLEEICKFLNWTCVDWRGELYFVDIDYQGKYDKYNLSLTNKEEVTKNELIVQEVGFIGTGNSLDVLPGFNKAIVKCSNYALEHIFPEEYFSKLKLYANQEKQSGDRVTIKNFYYPSVYDLFHYLPDGSGLLSDEQFETYKSHPDDLMGAMIVKRCEYNLVNGKPDITNYNWEELIQVRRGIKNSGNNNYRWLGRSVIISFKDKLPVAAYSDGAVAINCSVQITKNDDLTIDNEVRNGYVRALCEFSIGDYYYDGTKFVYGSSIPRFEIKFHLQNTPAGGFTNIENTKQLSQPYDGLTGYIIELPQNKPLTGDVKFNMYPLTPQPGSYTASFAGVGYYIKDLKMTYKLRDDLDNMSENADRIYENVLNETYIHEMDEIEMKISSYNDDGICYSKVLIKEEYESDYIRDNLYNAILDGNKRPEELLITRIINHYSATRIKLTQVLKRSNEISPFTVLSDTFLLGKKFINAGGSIDYKMNRFECIMIEV